MLITALTGCAFGHGRLAGVLQTGHVYRVFSLLWGAFALCYYGAIGGRPRPHYCYGSTLIKSTDEEEQKEQ
jgi:hypothetical protein